MKLLRIVKKTRKQHRCVFCGKAISAGLKVLALVTEEYVGGPDDTRDFVRDISYYCGMDCFNEADVRLIVESEKEL